MRIGDKMSNYIKDNITDMDGFHSYDSVYFRGFNDSILRNFEELIRAYNKANDLDKIIKFLQDLDKHLYHSESAHKFVIEHISDEVILDLYNIYRDNDFQGNISDMLLCIYKEVDIGSVADCLAGWSISKAVPVPGWLAMFKRHNSKPEVHEYFTSKIVPDDSPNIPPNIFLSTVIHDSNLIKKDTVYDLKGWTNRGTLCWKFNYDLRPYEQYGKTSFPLTTFKWDDSDDAVRLSIEAEKSNLGFVAKLQIRQLSDIKTIALPLPFEGYGLEKLVLSYSYQDMAMRDVLNGVVKYNPFDNKTINKVIFHMPLTQHLPTESPYACMLEFYHYNVVLDNYKQLFFLN